MSMYQQFFGLNKKPFDLAPDPSMVFMSEAHQEALSVFRYGIMDRKGFLMLTGQVGTGKTTLLQLLIASLDDNRIHLCMITNPTLSPQEFFYLLSVKYGLDEFDGNKAKFLLNFSDFLSLCRKNNDQVVLILDEAHVLPEDILEEIRLLSNQEHKDYGVLSIFLVGQPELQERLSTDRLLPLKQRIGIQFHLKQFTRQETKQYLLYRLRKAGAGHTEFFSTEALRLIHQHCNGTPRLINILCDHALLSGYAMGQLTIDQEIIQDCLIELDIAGKTSDTEPVASSAAVNHNGRYMITTALLIIITMIGAILYKADFNHQFSQFINQIISALF